MSSWRASRASFEIETFGSLLATGSSLGENLSMLRDCINDAAVNKLDWDGNIFNEA